jgi:hypothetical protein
VKSRFSRVGFGQMRRGFLDHFPRLKTGDAVALYLWLHLVVDWQGNNRGAVRTTYREIASEIGWSEMRVRRAMRRLRKRYVKITERGNQHQDSLFRILKYDKKPKRASLTDEQSKRALVTDARSYVRSSVRSTGEIANKTLGICPPNKGLEGVRINTKSSAHAPSETPKPTLPTYADLGIVTAANRAKAATA